MELNLLYPKLIDELYEHNMNHLRREEEEAKVTQIRRRIYLGKTQIKLKCMKIKIIINGALPSLLWNWENNNIFLESELKWKLSSKIELDLQQPNNFLGLAIVQQTMRCCGNSSSS